MKTLLLTLLAFVTSSAAFAGVPIHDHAPPTEPGMITVNILVAKSGTVAFANAENQANGSTVFAESTLWRALNRAADLINVGGEQTVNVLIAPGAYGGQFNAGIQRVPQLTNADGVLKIFGGMNDDFTERDPFTRTVSVPTTETRDGAIFQIAGNSDIREIVISGLVLDAAPSNSYDPMSGNLQLGSSRTIPVMSWAQMEAERVVIADNVIVNGAMAGFQIGASPPVDGTGEVIIENNFFINNLFALRTRTFGANAFRAFANLFVRNNTFALNFPANPDPTSSNVGAIEWHNDNSFDEMTFEGNLFAYNPGGAFQSDWEADDLPGLAIRNNLFFFNGALYGDGSAGDVIVAGKFGTNPTYILLDLDGIRDNLDAEVTGNVVLDPDLRLALVSDQPVDPSFIKAQAVELDDPRNLFGFDTGTVGVTTFAPETLFDERVVPIPRNPAAQDFGVQRSENWGLDQ